jgi:YycH protein.
MKFRWEQMKTMILVALVFLSIILFWNLVTFQQHYGFIQEKEYVKKVEIAEKREYKDLFLPNKLLLRSGQGFLGSENLEEISRVLKPVHQWNFYDFQADARDFIKYWENSEEYETVIFQFPDDVPMAMTKSIFTLETSNVPEGAFRYLILFTPMLEEREGIVYFLSPTMKTAFKARVRYEEKADFLTALDQFLQNAAVPYLARQKGNGGYLFIADQKMTLGTQYFYPHRYNPEIFMEALFPDPDLVKENGNRYTDGSSLMDIDPKYDRLTFVDPSVALESKISNNQLLQASVEFMNEHGGWTDAYVYYGSDTKKSTVNYQLYLQDYPVFSPQGNSEIELTISSGGVYEYDRPLFNLVTFKNPSEENYTLLSGGQILDRLESSGEVDLDKILDIHIGYLLVEDRENVLIKFVPAWFYRTEAAWEEITGGSKAGGD